MTGGDRIVVGLLLNYRDAALSARCILTLFNDGVQRVLVWDNSADGGSSASSIRAQFMGDDRLEVLVSEVNLGFSTGVNCGLGQCAVRYPKAWILLINNDARLLPDGLRRMVDALAANPAAEILCPNINHAGHVLSQCYYNRWTGLLSWRPRAGFFRYASGCCILIASERVGSSLFDEDFFMYGEDWELGWRLGRQSEAIAYLDETLVEHDGSASSGLGSPFYETHMVAAHLIMVRKLATSLLDACILYTLRWLMLTARALVRSLRFRSIIPFVSLLRGAQIARGRRQGR